jgi:hypothetical protein
VLAKALRDLAFEPDSGMDQLLLAFRVLAIQREAKAVRNWGVGSPYEEDIITVRVGLEYSGHRRYLLT